STPSRIGGVYTVGSSYNESGGYYDLLVTRYNLGGTIAYQDTFNLPTPGNIIAGAITTNSSLTELFITGTVYNGSANSYDVLTLKYDINGQVDWYSTYNGIGNGYDGGSSLLVDSDTIYVGGAITDTTGLFGALCIKYHDGGTEVWDRTLTPNNRNLAIGTLSKDSPNELMIGVGAEFNNGTHRVGSAVLATSDGSTLSGFSENSQVDLDEITGFAADADQNLYVTGYSDAAGNGDDMVTMMLNDTLGLVWESVYNGPANGDDRPSSLDIDTLGNVYVGGYTTGSNGRDFAVIKYNNSGTQQWAALYDGASHGDDEAKAVVAGKDGLVYATGSVDTLGQKDYHTRLLKASDGTTEWSASFNGLHSKDDEAASIALDGEGGLSVLGKNGLSNGSTEYMLVRYSKKQLTIPPGDGAASPALAFTEQRGQLTDTSGTSVEGVRFYSTGSYPPLYVQNDTLSFVTASVDTSSATPDTLHRVDITFFDSKTSLMSAAGLDQLDNYRNYYLGHIPEGRARVGQYGRVAVTDLYDGINLQMFSDKSGIVYYFVIQPGGDPDDIKLDFHGQDSLYLKARNLFVGTSLGDFNLPAPKAFQIDSLGQEVSTAWKPEYSIAGSRVSFSSTGSYDSTKVLVVELRREEVPGSPSQDWITYFGGNDSDVINGSDTDSDGNFYVAGTTFNQVFPEVEGVQVFGSPNFQFVFFTKFKASAALDYMTIFGGGGPENGYDILALDKVYVVGRTLSSDFPATIGIPSLVSQGFISSFSINDGQSISSKVLSASSSETELYAISGQDKSIYVGGQARSGSFSTTSNSSWGYHDSSNSGGRDGLLIGLDSDLNTSWSTHFGGSGEESIQDVVITPDEKLFIAGNTTTMSYSATSCNVPTDSGFPSCQPSGSSQFAFANGNSPALEDDIFIAEFDPEGNLSWATFMGGSLREKLLTSSSIDVNGNNLIILGASEQLSTMQANTGGGFQQSISGRGYFVAEFANRSLVWKTNYGCIEGSPNVLNLYQSIVYGAQGGIYISGVSDCATPVSSMDYCSAPPSGEFALCPPLGGTFYEDNSQGGFELFLTAFATDYTMEFATYFGGNEDEFITSITSIEDVLFLTGFTTSTQSFPVSFPQDSYEQDYNAGGTEGFVGRLNIGALVNSQEIESSAERLTIFPNPATDLLTISLPKDVKSHQREAYIYDMAGKLVMTKVLNHFETEVSIGNLPSGLYQVRVEEFTGRFIKI
ncbi:MAG: T9SS type A sorting domain-containing protein, partial [bacterium]|nr:T9SS type A sorting domain-containing protein [bacterium]